MCSCNQYPCCCGGSTTVYTLQPMAEMTGLETEVAEWVPSLEFTSVTDLSGATVTSGGNYMRIGKFIFFTGWVRSLGSIGASSGDAFINGLPYRSSATMSSHMRYPVAFQNTFGITLVAGDVNVAEFLAFIEQDDDFIQMYWSAMDDGIKTIVTHTNVGTNVVISFSGMYITD